MHMRLVATFVAVLMMAACAAETPPAQSPGQVNSTPPAATGHPTDPTPAPDSTPGTAPATGEPGSGPTLPPANPNATPPPITREPLPEPELDDPRQIGEAIASPQHRLQGVVSMLRGLGIGIYRRDGSVTRRGDEQHVEDMWLYEDEVHALAAMAAAESPRDLLSFRDWHAALGELGLSISASELMQAYVETYLYELNESFLVEVLLAQGLDMYDENPAYTRLTRLQAWLLLLDGFAVREDRLSLGQPIAQLGGGHLVASNHDREKWGGASSALPRLVGDGDVTWENVAAFAARLETLARSVPMSLSPASQSVHEGHGGEGSPVRFDLWFSPQTVAFTTPFGDGSLLLSGRAQPEGLAVRWEAADQGVLERHGRFVDERGGDPLASASRTDTLGRVAVGYTPRQEEAGGEGEEVREIVQLSARASLADVAERTWNVPPTLLAYLRGLGGELTTQTASLEIEWHEVHGLRIDMVDEYDIAFEFPKVRGADMSIGEVRKVGTDTFKGFLARQDDGTYRGVVEATVNAQQYVRAFGEECSTSLVARQNLLVVGELVGTEHRAGPGDPLLLRFYPIEPPRIERMACDYDLVHYYGSEYHEDPTIPLDRQIPSGQFGPFNDQRVLNPAENGFLTAKPEFGSRTYYYEEHAPGIGGGTWTVTIEVVEPSR
jgi:hypothetical protein